MARSNTEADVTPTASSPDVHPVEMTVTGPSAPADHATSQARVLGTW